jgi:hypothetical protein
VSWSRGHKRTTQECLFWTVHETHAALQSKIWTPQNGTHRKPSPPATPSWKLVPRPRSQHEKRTTGNAWKTWTVTAADSVCSAHAEWEIHFLSTLENSPFFCVCPVWIHALVTALLHGRQWQLHIPTNLDRVRSLRIQLDGRVDGFHSQARGGRGRGRKSVTLDWETEKW